LFDLAPPDVSVPSAEGHRSRMRDRLIRAGPDALADHEMLEMVLFLALPRRDTKPIARALLARFGGFAAVIAAPPADLGRIEGLGEAGIAALKLVRAAATRLLRAEARNKPAFDQWRAMVDYLVAAMAREKTEQFRVLFMDSRNRLLADEVLGSGTINHAPVYPREIVRRALELHATMVVLAHNHPSGDPRPSEEDIAVTRTIEAACAPLRIVVHEHIIIATSGYTSFRELGLL
jgi:DNA repair protein RadC